MTIDLLGTADRVRTASTVGALREPAFRIINRMQDVNPSDQYRALALAFLACTEALRLDPHMEVLRAARLMADAEGPFTSHVQAIRDYAAGELAHA